MFEGNFENVKIWHFLNKTDGSFSLKLKKLTKMGKWSKFWSKQGHVGPTWKKSYEKQLIFWVEQTKKFLFVIKIIFKTFCNKNHLDFIGLHSRRVKFYSGPSKRFRTSEYLHDNPFQIFYVVGFSKIKPNSCKSLLFEKLSVFYKRLPGLGNEPGIFWFCLFSHSIIVPLSTDRNYTFSRKSQFLRRKLTKIVIITLTPDPDVYFLFKDCNWKAIRVMPENIQFILSTSRDLCYDL
jgi:hypothetical protein